MSHWVFNTHYTSTPGPSSLQFAEKEPLTIRSSTLQTKVSVYDKYIIIKPRFENEDYLFTQYGTIARVDPPIKIESLQNTFLKETTPEPPEYLHNFILKPEGEIAGSPELENYSYSLLSVYRYLNPKVHFQQQVRKIQIEDYETITKEEIYIARTAFGNLINCLPKESKYDFVLYAIERFGTVEFKGINFIEAYGFLWEYINENILSQGKLLTETYETLRNLKETGIPVDRVGFTDGKDRDFLLSNITDDSISTQALYFNDLFEEMNNNNFSLQALRKIAKENIEENRFENIFKDKSWPVDMNI